MATIYITKKEKQAISDAASFILGELEVYPPGENTDFYQDVIQKLCNVYEKARVQK